MGKFDIPVKFKLETRGCVVNGELGLFHIWEFYSRPLDASPFVGGAPAGVFSKVYGIVEFSDGVRRVEPTHIQFCDEENEYLAVLNNKTKHK